MSVLFEDPFTKRPCPDKAWQTPLHAVHTLLANAADIAIGDDLAVTETMLEAGATCECEAHGLYEHVTVQWVLQQARYQIARTITHLTQGPQDPVIGLVLDVLAHHPPQVQARVLRRAAEHTANELDDC
ncbi:hypothetical protein [Actinomadura sp. 6K520]|uniref:hypothetical protein n=1 Tax=Actinomadura sp. 6K520 TaxID=2530364 RepID=UPI001042C3B8|nr:hypothetical protein [Actinomadura sp. 6K520]TDE22818.1 hypothetical protein E1289_29470 [Actinomadura sp. 6K520]